MITCNWDNTQRGRT